MPGTASNVTASMAGKFMETASAAGFSDANIAAMANNPEIMRGFALWCEETHPNFFAGPRIPAEPSKEELRKRLRISAKEIFTPEAIVIHGGRHTSIRLKVSLLMCRGAPLLNGVEWFTSKERNSFLDNDIRYLCVITQVQALVYPKTGPKAVEIIQSILADHGLQLGMDPALCRR